MPGAAAINPGADAAQGGLGRYLSDGETVILTVKPSFWFVLLRRGGAIGFLAGAWLLAAVGDRLGWWALGPRVEGIGLAFALAVILVLLWLAVDRATRLYLLTDRRVVRVSGVLSRTAVEIPLCKVTTVVLHRTLADRVTGVGSILFTSAAAGSGGGDLVWFMIDRPVTVVRTVREALVRYGGGQGTPGGGSGP